MYLHVAVLQLHVLRLLFGTTCPVKPCLDYDSSVQHYFHTSSKDKRSISRVAIKTLRDVASYCVGHLGRRHHRFYSEPSEVLRRLHIVTALT